MGICRDSTRAVLNLGATHMEQTQISLQALIQCAVIIGAVWGFYKIIMEIVEAIVKRHDKEEAWSKATADLEKTRKDITDKYDTRLDELEAMINDNHTDTEAKMQEIKADILILTKSVSAILDGLKQQGCNGKVTEAKENLEKYLMDKAYE